MLQSLPFWKQYLNHSLSSSFILRKFSKMYISALIKVLFLALVGADMAAAYACSNAGAASVGVLSTLVICFYSSPTYMLGCCLRLLYKLVQAQKATCVRQCRGGSIYIDCSASYVCSSPINNPETPRFWTSGWISETDWATSVHKITRSPQAPANALATISLDGMRLGGSGRPMAFWGGARWLVSLVGIGILRRLSLYI